MDRLFGSATSVALVAHAVKATFISPLKVSVHGSCGDPAPHLEEPELDGPSKD